MNLIATIGLEAYLLGAIVAKKAKICRKKSTQKASKKKLYYRLLDGKIMESKNKD